MSELVLNYTSDALNYSVGKCVPDSDGDPTMTVPCTLLKPGVLNGSQGPLYYPSEEIQRSAQLWEHLDVTLDHPIEDHRRTVGLIKNIRSTSNKLAADLLLWCGPLKTHSPNLFARILLGERVEISTGLKLDRVPANEGSTFGGIPYLAVARNFRPDHLAILEHQTGACSLQDGCGVFNQDSQKEKNMANYLDSNSSITVSGVRVMTVPNPGCCPAPTNLCVACFQRVMAELGSTGSPQLAQNQEQVLAPFGLPNEYVG